VLALVSHKRRPSKQVQQLQDVVKDFSANKKNALAYAAKVEKQKASRKLSCIMNVSAMKTAVLSCQKPGERKLKKRDDLAQILHAYKYLGGGKPEQQLKYIQNEETRLDKGITATNQKIKRIQATIQNFHENPKSSNAAPVRPNPSLLLDPSVLLPKSTEPSRILFCMCSSGYGSICKDNERGFILGIPLSARKSILLVNHSFISDLYCRLICEDRQYQSYLWKVCDVQMFQNDAVSVVINTLLKQN
jgi:hypothetical protein